MRFAPFALFAAAAHVCFAVPPGPSKRASRCGTPAPGVEHVKISQGFAAQESAAFATHGNLTTRATIVVDLHFHVVAASKSVNDGYVSVRNSSPLPSHDPEPAAT